MKLFSFMGKKESKEPVPKETLEQEVLQETLKDLVVFNQNEGNYSNAFYFAHKKEADRRETQIVNLRVQARDAKDHKARLKALQECKTHLDEFRTWCEKYKHGDLYYKEWIGGRPDVPSYYEQLVTDLEREQRIEAFVIPAIMEKTKGGILRTELLKQFDEADKPLVRSALNELEKNKMVKKDKVNNKVFIKRCK